MRQLKTRHPGSPTATPATGDDAPRRRRLRLPTSGAALAVSIVALVVAMAGSAYAGVTLGKNSVGTKQLQKGAVTNGKIAKGAVGAGKLKKGLVVPNATHASTADLATNATNATHATSATSATTATNATNATNAVNATNATTATNGLVTFGSWAGPTPTIPVSSGFVFAGPTVTLTTTATQSVIASSESALATSAATASADISICKSPATGTPTVTELDPAPGGAFSNVTVTTNRATYAANGVGAPGAGTWLIGECVNDTSTTQAIDSNDWTLGHAFVVNGTPAPGSTAVKPGGASHNG
jgi:hypothetical protein